MDQNPKKIVPCGRFTTQIIKTHEAGQKAYLLLELIEELKGLNLRRVRPQNVPFVNYDEKEQHCFILGDWVTHSDSTSQFQYYTRLLDDFLDGDISKLSAIEGKELTTTWFYHCKFGFTFPGFSAESNPEIN